MTTPVTSWVVNLWHGMASRPWLAVVLGAVFVAGVFGRDQLLAWRHRRLASGARWVTIAAPPEVTPESAGRSGPPWSACSPRRCGGGACTARRMWRGSTPGPAAS